MNLTHQSANQQRVVDGQPRHLLELRSVSKAFDAGSQSDSERRVLHEIDLNLSIGEFVSIIGPSGCGKSTLLNVISGLDEEFSGEISYSGAPGSRLGQISYMQQKDLLLPWRTVLDNAALGLELRGVSHADSRARASERLGQFGLEEYSGAYPAQLSGGMRQRVALLRATLPDTPLLLLDEPFGALDALTRSEMHIWLVGLLADTGKSVVLVTHDVDEAILLSDHVYVMKRDPGVIDSQFDVVIGDRTDPGVVTSDAFTALKAQLLAALRSGGTVGVSS
ncbi:MAG: ABC transporter ATP-binding protein [Chloroflexi bacterium]|nr:ABC transporter ATP-binding protein [Chloroflexota bacterium]